MGLKMRGTAQDALDQINSKDYAIPYLSKDKPIIKIRYRLFKGDQDDFRLEDTDKLGKPFDCQ